MPLRLRPDIATTDTDDGLVLLDERTGRYWQLNPTGAHVLHALADGRHPDDIARDLATRYRIDVQQAQRDVTALTDHLHTAKLVASSRAFPPPWNTSTGYPYTAACCPCSRWALPGCWPPSARAGCAGCWNSPAAALAPPPSSKR